MVLPIRHDRRQQIGAAKKRTVGRCDATENDMIAATRSRMAAVEHKLLGAKAGVVRFLVKRGGNRDRTFPVCRRVNVDLDDAGIGRHLDHIETRIGRRVVALDLHRHAGLLGGLFDGSNQRSVIFSVVERRHEHADCVAAGLDSQSRADGARNFRRETCLLADAGGFERDDATLLQKDRAFG